MTALPALALLLTACGAPASGDDGPDTPVQLVTSVYPLAWMAEQIAPDAQIRSLAARGQDSHDLELSPREREALDDADVVAYLGQIGFQPQVEQAVDAARGEVVDVSATLGKALLSIDDHADDDHADDPTPTTTTPTITTPTTTTPAWIPTSGSTRG